MPYNAKADIHAGMEYSTLKGVKYTCTRADWHHDTINHLHQPKDIHLLKQHTTEPQPISTEKMISLLERGSLVVIKRPF
ncbi:MAG: hypothetical protein V4619_15480 [Bacteroidota bacterium]